MSDAGPQENAYLSEAGLAISPDGTKIAANQSSDRKLLGLSGTSGTTIWDTTDGTILERFDNGRTGALAWHPGGDLLAIGGTSTVSVVEPTGDERWLLQGAADEAMVIGLAFHPEGTQLASLGSDGSLRLWSLGDGGCSPLHELRIDGGRGGVDYSPDGEVLAASGPGGVSLWDTSDGKGIQGVPDVEGHPYGLAYDMEGDLIIGTGEPAAIHIISADGDVLDGPAPRSLRPLHIAPASGRIVAVGGEHDNQVLIWDRNDESRKDLPRVRGSVGVLRWSPDGATLYGVSRSQGVIAWSGSDWEPFDLP